MIKRIFGSNVLVKPRDVEEKLASGIILPNAKGQKQQVGEVIAVGSGYILDDGSRVPVEVTVGSLVVFAKFAGTQLVDGGEDYLVLHEKDIIAEIGE